MDLQKRRVQIGLFVAGIIALSITGIVIICVCVCMYIYLYHNIFMFDALYFFCSSF